MAESPSGVTELLLECTGGNKDALDRLMPLVYTELRKLAGAYLRREPLGHTLQPTALANEAYLRLIDQTRVRWQNRAHFFAIAGQLMRRILVDHARKHHAAKRGGGVTRLALDEALDQPKQKDVDVIALDEALESLAGLDPRQSRIVELRFFAGLNVEETAEILGVSPITVKREWRTAKAWLYRELSGIKESDGA